MFSSFNYSGNPELIRSLESGSTALKVNELGKWIRQVTSSCEESSAILNFVQKRVPYLFSVIFQNDVKNDSLNAGELIFHYVQFSPDKKAVEDVIAEGLKLFHPSSYPLSQESAEFLKRACELCMAKNIMWTNCAVAKCLSTELIDGMLMNASSSSIITEVIMELLGAHVMFAKYFQQDLFLASFTSAWVKLEFPKKLVSHVLEALHSPEKYLVVALFKEICLLGFNPAVGPLVDALFDKSLLDSFLAAICLSSKLFLRHPNGNGCPVPEVLDTFTSLLRIVRQSISFSDGSIPYNSNVLKSSPVFCVCARLDDFVDLLRISCTQNGQTAVFSRVRASICSVVKELLLFGLKSIDETVRDSGFFDVFMNLCQRFPNNNYCAQILGECFSAIFSRKNCEKNSDNFYSDVLLEYFSSVEGSTHILQICTFVADESYGFFAIRSQCFRVLQLLLEKEWFSANNLLEIKESTETRVAAMSALLDTELTGKNFEQLGSAEVRSPVKEDVSDYAGEKELCPLRSSPDIEKKEEEPVVPFLKSLESGSQDNFLMGDLISEQVQAYPSFSNVMLAFAERSDDQ